MTGLSAKRERFAQEYAIDGNGAQAAIRAGYSANSAKVTASRLLTDANVCAAVAELQEKVAEKYEVTAETIAKQLDEDRALALECKQAAAAVSASMGKAKLFGLIVDRKEVDQTTRFVAELPSETETEDQWLQENSVSQTLQ